MSDYKEMVQTLQKATNIINDSGIRELTGVSDYLNSSLQRLQEKDSNEVSTGAYQIVEEAGRKIREIKRNCERVERTLEEKKNELERHISLIQDLTQKLLSNQQLQSYQVVLPK